MPINVEHNVDPRLLGQAALLAGQGFATQNALHTLANLPPQQTQAFHLGKLPQSGVGQVTDALANGDLGGDPGLAQDMASRQGDTGGSLYDPALGDHDPNNPNWTPPKNSIYNPDGSHNENFYGGTDGDAAAATGRQQQLDDDSMQREQAYRQKVAMLTNDDSLTDSSKQYALKRLAANHALAKQARPYNYKPSAQEQFDSQLVKHPDGSSYVQNPDGSFTPHAPTPPPDPTPIDPTNPLTMQPSVEADPTEPPKSKFQQHLDESTVQNRLGQLGTWDGKKFTPFEKPKKEPATEKDETRAQFMKEYNTVKKELTVRDPDGKSENDKIPTKEEILQHMRDATDAFEAFHGRKAHANIPQPDEQTTKSPPQVKSAEDYAAIPRGAQYMDVYGHIRVKQ